MRKYILNLESKYFIALGIFLIVFSAIAVTINIYGVSMPFYDEWDAEAAAMYSNLETKSYSFGNIFDSHNGHRIVFTRITQYILYFLNGGWDPELQLFVNAFLHALTAAFLFVFVSAHQNRTENIFSAIAVLILFAIPFSWMSILVPFQTQFYYMIFFSIISMYGLCENKYLLGIIFALFAYMSMTPGAFVLPAYIVTALIGCIREKSICKKDIFTLILIGLLFLLFVLMQGSDTSTSSYSSHSVRDFLVSLIAAFWWPFNASQLAGVVVHLPIAALTLKALRESAVPKLYLAIAWFVWLQLIAMALFRGAGGVPPANRYWELLLIGMVINLISAIHLIYKSEKNLAKNALFCLWLSIATVGMYQLAVESLTTGLQTRMTQNQTALAMVAEFTETGDETVFDGFEGLDISYPDKERLITLLRNPNVASILPTSITKLGTNQLAWFKSIIFQLSWLIAAIGTLLFSAGILKAFNKNRI